MKLSTHPTVMRRVHVKLLINAFAVISIIISGGSVIFAGERELFQSIRNYPAKLTDSNTRTCRSFLKKYPNSVHAQEVRLILARAEKSPVSALSLYDAILSEEASTDIFDESVIAACQLSLLLSRFDACEKYARMAIRKNTSSAKDGAAYLIQSSIVQQDYEIAESNLVKYSEYLTAEDRKFYRNAIALHTGNERSSYGSGISDPSMLYLYGRDFEFQNKRQFAYSAYKDLVRKYPRSPEALLCTDKIVSMEKSSVKYSDDYLDSMKKGPVDAMFPDREILDDPMNLVYSVLVGPFNSEKDARILKKEMTDDFDGVVIVKNGRGFFVFIGSEPSAEMAVSLKVRLAEEFGLNGKIVQRRNENGREYIYGE